jgi:hypothetical protein
LVRDYSYVVLISDFWDLLDLIVFSDSVEICNLSISPDWFSQKSVVNGRLCSQVASLSSAFFDFSHCSLSSSIRAVC